MAGRRSPLALLAMAILVAGCSTTAPTQEPTIPAHLPPNTATPIPPTRGSTLVVRLGYCSSTIGCHVYGSLTPHAMPTFGDVKLFGWPADETESLPSTLEPGTYTARFRFVMPTDAIAGNDPWQTIAECEDEVVATGEHLGEEFDLLVRYDGTDCVITQNVSVANS